MVVVFCCGVAVMGLEMSASRLLAPFFGSTLTVWTSLIGLIIAFLTIGYYLGGAIADRSPRERVLGSLVLAAGLLVCGIAFAVRILLDWCWSLGPSIGLLGGSMLGTFLLFVFPMTLLGCVPPFALRLYLNDLERAGKSSGTVYAISALGSIIGTFLPTLLTIPLLGARQSVLVFGLLLATASLTLLPRSRAARAVVTAVSLLAMVGGTAFAARWHPEPLVYIPGMQYVEERDTPYNYIRVVKAGPARILVVDNGAFSMYSPGRIETGEYFDYLLLAPLLRPEPTRISARSLLVIGLAAGTCSKQATAVFGPLPIDGVEIDPGIIEAGRRYFAMDEPNLKVWEMDGRSFVSRARKRYDWVIIDAYQGSAIPFQLITEEFFRLLRSRMTSEGVVAINVAWVEPNDKRLLELTVATLQAVFDRIYVADLSKVGAGRSGAIVYGCGRSASPRHLRSNAERTGSAFLILVAKRARGLIQEGHARTRPLTDDRAPLEQIIEPMYLRANRDSRDRQMARGRGAGQP